MHRLAARRFPPDKQRHSLPGTDIRRDPTMDNAMAPEVIRGCCKGSMVGTRLHTGCQMCRSPHRLNILWPVLGFFD